MWLSMTVSWLQVWVSIHRDDYRESWETEQIPSEQQSCGGKQRLANGRDQRSEWVWDRHRKWTKERNQGWKRPAVTSELCRTARLKSHFLWFWGRLYRNTLKKNPTLQAASLTSRRPSPFLSISPRGFPPRKLCLASRPWAAVDSDVKRGRLRAALIYVDNKWAVSVGCPLMSVRQPPGGLITPAQISISDNISWINLHKMWRRPDGQLNVPPDWLAGCPNETSHAASSWHLCSCHVQLG